MAQLRGALVGAKGLGTSPPPSPDRRPPPPPCGPPPQGWSDQAAQNIWGPPRHLPQHSARQAVDDVWSHAMPPQQQNPSQHIVPPPHNLQQAQHDRQLQHNGPPANYHRPPQQNFLSAQQAGPSVQHIASDNSVNMQRLPNHVQVLTPQQAQALLAMAQPLGIGMQSMPGAQCSQGPQALAPDQVQGVQVLTPQQAQALLAVAQPLNQNFVQHRSETSPGAHAANNLQASVQGVQGAHMAPPHDGKMSGQNVQVIAVPVGQSPPTGAIPVNMGCGMVNSQASGNFQQNMGMHVAQQPGYYCPQNVQGMQGSPDMQSMQGQVQQQPAPQGMQGAGMQSTLGGQSIDGSTYSQFASYDGCMEGQAMQYIAVPVGGPLPRVAVPIGMASSAEQLEAPIAPRKPEPPSKLWIPEKNAEALRATSSSASRLKDGVGKGSTRALRIINPNTGQEVHGGPDGAEGKRPLRIVDPKTGQALRGLDGKRGPLRIVNPHTGESVLPQTDQDNSTCTPYDTPPSPWR